MIYPELKHHYFTWLWGNSPHKLFNSSGLSWGASNDGSKRSLFPLNKNLSPAFKTQFLASDISAVCVLPLRKPQRTTHNKRHLKRASGAHKLWLKINKDSPRKWNKNRIHFNYKLQETQLNRAPKKRHNKNRKTTRDSLTQREVQSLGRWRSIRMTTDRRRPGGSTDASDPGPKSTTSTSK